MKKILFAASEAVPFIKTGGLADVVGSLPKCFDKRYFDVRVIIPKYLCIIWDRAVMWASFSMYMRELHFTLLTMKAILTDQSHMGTGIGIWRNSVSSAVQLFPHYL